MIITVDEKFKKICKKIKDGGKTLQEWKETGYSDEFYDLPYAGGFEEEAFYFSYFADDGNEYIFQVTLEDVDKVLSGKLTEIKAKDEVNIFSI